MRSVVLPKTSSAARDKLRRPGENLHRPGEIDHPHLKYCSYRRSNPHDALICSWNLDTELRARPPLFGSSMQSRMLRRVSWSALNSHFFDLSPSLCKTSLLGFSICSSKSVIHCSTKTNRTSVSWMNTKQYIKRG
ncbi:hypothetical protein U1Q18_041983 [Sarracenia purpurea var. burkii]